MMADAKISRELKTGVTMRIVLLVSAAAVLGGSAGAQTAISPRIGTKLTLEPSATVTYQPVSNGSVFNGTWVNVYTSKISTYAADGRAMLWSPAFVMGGSSVALVTNNGQISNGTYSVQFYFTYTNEPTVVAIKIGSAQILECNFAVQADWNTPENACDSGQFEITDNRLAVSANMKSGGNIVLTRIVLNSYPALRLR